MEVFLNVLVYSEAMSSIISKNFDLNWDQISSTSWSELRKSKLELQTSFKIKLIFASDKFLEVKVVDDDLMDLSFNWTNTKRWSLNGQSMASVLFMIFKSFEITTSNKVRDVMIY